MLAHRGVDPPVYNVPAIAMASVHVCISDYTRASGGNQCAALALSGVA